MTERVQKLIAAGGLCSRRTAEAWIEAGRVTVNGETCTMRGKKLRPGDSFAFDGRTYRIRSDEA